VNDFPEILIADDSKSNRLSLAAALSDLNADLLIASNGMDTIRLATTHRPALIILDVDMPDMDGYQVANHLAGNGRTVNIPIIFMETNFARHKATLHGNSIWPPELIYKPVNYEQLNYRVATLLLLAEYRNSIATIRQFEDEMEDKTDEGIAGIDKHGRIRYCNPTMIKMLRTRYTEILGIGLESIFEKAYHDTDPQWQAHPVATALAVNKTVQVKKATLWTNDGGKVTTTFVAVPIKDHPVLQALLVFKDISRRSRADAQITSITTHDPLTGLANRFKFEEVLRGLIALYKAKTNVLISRKRAAPCAVLYVGIDHFSHINKGLGHNVGDKLLQGVAHRIRNCISDLDIVARLGGDEFTVALTHMFDVSHATTVAQNILKSLDEAFLIDGNEIFSSVSIGIATYPECADTTGDLLTNSSIAMQIAKDNGRHGIQYFTESLNQNYLEKIDREGEFREAVAKDLLELRFQPFISADEEHVLGHYMSLIWDNPDRTSVDATDIISGMENNQIQAKLTHHMLTDGVRKYNEFRLANLTDTNTALVIPFPAFQLMNTSFINNLRSVLAHNDLPAGQLILEINETRTDLNLKDFQVLAKQIAELGAKLALNLFSSPKTPLTHLFQIDLDILRIDLRDIDPVAENPRSVIFIRSITNMAHDLDIKVIIDGVSNDTEVDLLRAIGVDGLMGERFGMVNLSLIMT
jgi:diguanylate cyclase (GGDEF)-like protein